jgi:hypothetical protein
MTDLSETVAATHDEFTDGPAGSPTMPCGGSAEGGIGRSVGVAIAKARRWVFGHFTQQKSNSCVIASSRNMIHALTGENIPEKTLQDEMKGIIGDPNHDFETTGVNPMHAETLLQKHGVKTESHYNVSSDQLPDLVKDGKPALIGFKNPGHRVMLDSVSIDKDGNRTYNVRDPDPAYEGRVREMSQSDFDAKYNTNAIVIVGKAAE